MSNFATPERTTTSSPVGSKRPALSQARSNSGFIRTLAQLIDVIQPFTPTIQMSQTDNIDPSFWTDQLFDDDDSNDMEISSKALPNQSSQLDWRASSSSEKDSPPNSPKVAQRSLPLEKDSPAYKAVEDFSSSPNGSSGLHNLIPALGVSSRSDGSAFNDTSGSYPMKSMNGPPLGTSPPANQLHRQAVTQSRSAAGDPIKSPSVQSYEPSPLGRYYLSSSDPQHISKHPQGSVSFPGNSLNPTKLSNPLSTSTGSPALRNIGDMESPTLSLASDETLTLGDDFADSNTPYSGTRQTMFPAMPHTKAPGSRTIGHSRLVPNTAPSPHQIPLPPSPHMQGSPISPSTTFKNSPSGLRAVNLGFGSTGGQLGSGKVPPSPSQIQRAAHLDTTSMGNNYSRPRMRQETADSFISTSSEEEDVSSPMVLPDRSLKASERQEDSPRARIDATFGSTSTNGNGQSLFPALSHVQRLGNMAKSQFAFGVQPPQTPFIGYKESQRSTYQPSKDAPVFPPMSPSSSSSVDSDDGTQDSKPKVRFAGPVSPERRPKFKGQGLAEEDPEDGGDYGHGYGGGKGYKAEEDKDGNRSGSITVGGRGYGDGSYATPKNNGRDDSSDDEDRPKRGNQKDKRLEASKQKKGNSATNKKATFGIISDTSELTGEEDENESSGSDGNISEYETNAGTTPKRRGTKRKAIPARVDDLGSNADNKSEGSSNSVRLERPDFMPSKAKRRKSGPADDGDVHCEYIEPLPPYEQCTSHFHRTYDLARHLETIHARNEGRAVEAGQLNEKDAKLWIEYGRPQCSWPCPVPTCGQIFSRKDAMQRHLKTKRHGGALVGGEYL